VNWWIAVKIIFIITLVKVLSRKQEFTRGNVGKLVVEMYNFLLPVSPTRSHVPVYQRPNKHLAILEVDLSGDKIHFPKNLPLDYFPSFYPRFLPSGENLQWNHTCLCGITSTVCLVIKFSQVPPPLAGILFPNNSLYKQVANVHQWWVVCHRLKVQFRWIHKESEITYLCSQV
jgi:hypothetical protein